MTRGERKSFSLREVVEVLGGEIIGNPEIRIRQVSTLENAGPEAITFLSNERYQPQLKSTRAAAVIIHSKLRNATELSRIICSNPYAYFAHVSTLLNPARPAQPGRHESAVIDFSAIISDDAEVGPCAVIGRNVRIGARCLIGAGCVIGDDAVLGDDVRLHSNVTIYDSCVIGKRVILHAGVVIGADGFGIAMVDEKWLKIPQIGRVIIGDDVEIGANTTVDRGTIDDTVIEEGAKLDNQIQIAHNVHIGAHTAIAACAGIAGSAKIGRHCRIGGASGIAGHLTIADQVEISAHTIITKSIYKSGTYTGAYPFEENRGWRKNAAQLRHLNELADRVRALEKQLAQNGRSNKS
jgi:UDP-3-O-[3-hydroxymyristoyl] glucosamine N-acyltransferase